MAMGEGRRRGYNDFSLKMSSSLSLSKRWVCCVVKNLSRIFLFEQPLILLWVMRVYIVWMKGKKVTPKILQAKSFVGASRVGPTHKTIAKLIAWHDSRKTVIKLTVWHDSSASSMCFSCALFAGTFTHELLASQL